MRIVFIPLLLVVTFYAFLRGGRPERLAAASFVTAYVATFLLHRPFASRYDAVEWGVLAVDVTLLGVLLWIALRADRYWPIWLTAMQALTISGHLAKAISPSVLPGAYQVAILTWGYAMVVMLGLGVARHHHRLIAGVPSRSWSSFSTSRPRRQWHFLTSLVRFQR